MGVNLVRKPGGQFAAETRGSITSGKWGSISADFPNTTQNVNGELCISPDGNHIFYRGLDNYVHQQYYQGNGAWAHDWIICYDDLINDLKANAEITATENSIYYRGLDNKIHYFSYNTHCVPRETLIFESTSLRGETFSEIQSIKDFPYPNPFSNSISFNASESDISKVELYNSLGQLKYFSNIKASSISIQADDLDSGLYFLKITSLNNSVRLFKLIKK